MQNQELTTQTLLSAFEACSAGIATPEQEALKSAVFAALESHITEPEMVSLVSNSVGSFASVYEREWSDLNPMQRWVREQSASADRTVPALRDMASVYRSLITADKKNGPGLHLGTGVNVIGLDNEGRRWLVPRVSESALSSVMEAESRKEARAVVRASGSTSFHWSTERTYLVPDPDDLLNDLPLPDGGKYLLIYRGPTTIITKEKFIKAFDRLSAACPIADFLVWDQHETPAVLWSVRGNMGHRAGVDTSGWPEHLAEYRAHLSALMSR